VTYRLGVDVGGTFTDVLLHDSERQRVWLAKTPSTPGDQSVGVIEGIQLAAASAGISLGQLDAILHGTTVATNAVLERRGALVGLIVTQGFRHMYGKKEVHKVDDIKGYKVRVQATATEDAMFAAYGAQTVHMPFGSVYTSLQTGVVDVAENGVNVYLANKHYEVAPVLSMTEHEANNNFIWISDKLWKSLTDEQKKWVTAAADEVGRTQPAKSLELEHQSADKLKAIGVGAETRLSVLPEVPTSERPA
jgi:TRAP-type C4-dicarboxylate transport system substrate-binding protein